MTIVKPQAGTQLKTASPSQAGVGTATKIARGITQ